MTLFTKNDCKLCDQIKKQFDLEAMEVHVEVLDSNDAGALAHLAWHGQVEAARKTLPILVLDDSSSIEDFPHIESHLINRADQFGISSNNSNSQASCEDGSCAMQ